MHKSRTIMVIDPDERSYKTFESVLGANNSVLFVPNGKTAIDFPDSHPIDIVFVSHKLNGTDGMHFLGTFKKKFPSIPVVLMAEEPNVDDVITAFRSGARELIVKPIDENELVAVAQKIFGFVSPKKPKRKWFFTSIKKTQTNNAEKKGTGPLRKVFQKSKQSEILSAEKYEGSQTKNSIPLAKDASSPLNLGVSLEPMQPDKVAHLSLPVESAHPLIEGFFFGSFRVLVNNQPIKNWPSKKGKSIFAYLLLNHKKKIFRDTLMDLLWRKSDPDSARNCLNVTIHGIRRVLQEIDLKTEYILFKDECYYFNAEIDIKLDVEEFRKKWLKAQSIEHNSGLRVAVIEYERAAEIYRGEFLEDEIYDDWSSLDRENLKEIYLVILDKISENFMQNGNHREAISICKKILEKDNCREDIYRRLMECFYGSGHRDRAIKIFRKCTKSLKTELEVEPTAATIQLYRRIKGK
jgi:two-component SAPR family response regulator